MSAQQATLSELNGPKAYNTRSKNHRPISRNSRTLAKKVMSMNLNSATTITTKQHQHPRLASNHGSQFGYNFARNFQLGSEISFGLRRAPFGHEEAIQAVCFAPDSSKFVSVGQDSRLLVWSCASNWIRLVGIAELESKFSTAVDISPNGYIIGVGGLNNRCSIYYFDARKPLIDRPLQEFTNPYHMLVSCKFLTENNLICAHGNLCYLNDIYEARNSSTHSESSKFSHRAQITGLDTLHGYSNNYITSSSDKRIKLWDVRSDQPGAEFKMSYELNYVKTCRSQPNIFTTCYDNKISIYDLRYGKPFANFDASSNYSEITSLEMSKNGRYVFATDDQGILACYDIFNVKNGVKSYQIINTPDATQTMQMSNNGQAMVVGSSSSELHLVQPLSRP